MFERPAWWRYRGELDTLLAIIHLDRLEARRRPDLAAWLIADAAEIEAWIGRQFDDARSR